MENVGLFNGHLVHFTAIWYTLWSFTVGGGRSVYFSRFGYVALRNIWQPWLGNLNPVLLTLSEFKLCKTDSFTLLVFSNCS
jgi:hypothetical protein